MQAVKRKGRAGGEKKGPPPHRCGSASGPARAGTCGPVQRDDQPCLIYLQAISLVGLEPVEVRGVVQPGHHRRALHEARPW